MNYSRGAATMVTPADASEEPTLVKDWRFYSGMAALVLSLIVPFGALLVPMLGLSTAASSVLAGVMVAGGPEVLCILSAALMGKKTFQYISHRVKAAFLERPASKRRYYACLVVVLLSWIPLYIYAYFPSALPADPARLYFLISMDLAFVVAVFLMGPEFWEKVRRIFVYEGAVYRFRTCTSSADDQAQVCRHRYEALYGYGEHSKSWGRQNPPRCGCRTWYQGGLRYESSSIRGDQEAARGEGPS